MYNDNYNASLVGGLSVGVPGEIRGYELLHKKYGQLPWSKLFEPSIKLAEHGFEAGPELVKRLDLQKKWLLNSTEFVKIYAPSGQLVKVDDIVYRKNYAKTLKKIAKEGSKGFYEGEVAQEIANYVQKNGGIITLEDLKNYKAIVKEPSIGTFLGSKVISTTAPSSGSVLVSTLGLLDAVIKQNGTGSQVDLYHRFVEALKFGFSARTRIGDPAYNSTITPFEKEIIKKDYIKKLLSRVDLKQTHDFNYYNPSYDTKELPGTTHISVIDKDGFAVSLTTTVNMNFGSQLMTPEFGIILNDEMNDFSVPNVSNGFGLAPSPLNWVQPGKRPLSSTVPSILVKEDGEIIALGGAGGSLIISATAQVLLEIYLNKKGLQEAVDNARIHNQLLPQITQVEQSFNQTLIDGLVAKGHNVTKWSNLSQVQIVTKKCDGSVEGNFIIFIY
jgi:gamma-glutamyltranspeptidase